MLPGSDYVYNCAFIFRTRAGALLVQLLSTVQRKMNLSYSSWDNSVTVVLLNECRDDHSFACL